MRPGESESVPTGRQPISIEERFRSALANQLLQPAMFTALNGQLTSNNSSSGGDSAQDGDVERALFSQNGPKRRRLGATNFSINEASLLLL